MTTLFDIFKNVGCLTSEMCGFEITMYLGNPLEINQIRRNESDLRETKFPAIFMFFDIEEDHTILTGNYTISPTFAIVNQTEKSYIAEQRDELNFKPVLLPIYENFIKAIKYSGYFNNVNNVDHRKANLYFYGSDENQSEFDGNMDAIRLDLIDLEIKKTC